MSVVIGVLWKFWREEKEKNCLEQGAENNYVIKTITLERKSFAFFLL